MDKTSKHSDSKFHVRYSTQFKHRVCREYMLGHYSEIELLRKHEVGGHGRIKSWLSELGYIGDKTDSRLITDMKEPDDIDKNREELLKRIKELEKVVEDNKLKVEAYSKMIEIAEKEFKINIRKKSNTK